jgi:D-arabinose 1-dehydrogenase-like Zn-dependent alcohol dehydrogenase
MAYGLPQTRADEYQDVAWGLPEKGGKFVPMYISRPLPGDKDIKMEVLYSGICHSDCTIA